MPPLTWCHHQEQFLISTSLSLPVCYTHPHDQGDMRNIWCRSQISDLQNWRNWNQSSSDQDKMIWSQIWCEWLVMCQSQYGLTARYSDAIFALQVMITVREPSQLNVSKSKPSLDSWFWIYIWICTMYYCIFDCNYGNSGRVIQIGDRNKISHWRLWILNDKHTSLY